MCVCFPSSRWGTFPSLLYSRSSRPRMSRSLLRLPHTHPLRMPLAQMGCRLYPHLGVRTAGMCRQTFVLSELAAALAMVGPSRCLSTMVALGQLMPKRSQPSQPLVRPPVCPCLLRSVCSPPRLANPRLALLGPCLMMLHRPQLRSPPSYLVPFGQKACFWVSEFLLELRWA